MNTNWIDALTSSRAIRVAAIAVLVFLALYLLVGSVSTLRALGRPGVPATDTITVTGQGQAFLAPDVARLSFTIEHKAATAAEAQSATTKQANSVIASVRKEGIAEKDIKTLSYNIYPQYEYGSSMPCTPEGYCPPSRSPRVVGYQVSQSVQVTVRDLDKVNDLIASLGGQNVQNLSGPEFALDDPAAGYDAARADAIEKAKARAKELGKQLGVRLGKIVSFSESQGYYPYPAAYGMGGAMEKSVAPTPDIPSGQNQYNATVTITYDIR